MRVTSLSFVAALGQYTIGFRLSFVRSHMHICAFASGGDSLGFVGCQIGDLFEALGQSMNVGRDEITRFQVSFCIRAVHSSKVNDLLLVIAFECASPWF